jgi:hypothetical protein
MITERLRAQTLTNEQAIDTIKNPYALDEVWATDIDQVFTNTLGIFTVKGDDGAYYVPTGLEVVTWPKKKGLLLAHEFGNKEIAQIDPNDIRDTYDTYDGVQAVSIITDHLLTDALTSSDPDRAKASITRLNRYHARAKEEDIDLPSIRIARSAEPQLGPIIAPHHNTGITDERYAELVDHALGGRFSYYELPFGILVVAELARNQHSDNDRALHLTRSYRAEPPYFEIV